MEQIFKEEYWERNIFKIILSHFKPLETWKLRFTEIGNIFLNINLLMKMTFKQTSRIIYSWLTQITLISPLPY